LKKLASTPEKTNWGAQSGPPESNGGCEAPKRQLPTSSKVEEQARAQILKTQKTTEKEKGGPRVQ